MTTTTYRKKARVPTEGFTPRELAKVLDETVGAIRTNNDQDCRIRCHIVTHEASIEFDDTQTLAQWEAPRSLHARLDHAIMSTNEITVSIHPTGAKLKDMVCGYTKNVIIYTNGKNRERAHAITEKGTAAITRHRGQLHARKIRMWLWIVSALTAATGSMAYPPHSIAGACVLGALVGLSVFLFTQSLASREINVINEKPKGVTLKPTK